MNEILAEPENNITRYIYTKNDFSINGVKHSAFMPPTSYPNEISVFIIDNLAQEEIWKIGTETRKDKSLKARGDLLVSDVLKISDEQEGKLQVLVNGVPHPRHANIKKIPLEKSLQRTVATELAKKTVLNIPI